MVSRKPWWQLAQSPAWGFGVGAFLGVAALACWLAVVFAPGLRNLPFMVAAGVMAVGCVLYVGQAVYLRRKASEDT